MAKDDVKADAGEGAEDAGVVREAKDGDADRDRDHAKREGEAEAEAAGEGEGESAAGASAGKGTAGDAQTKVGDGEPVQGKALTLGAVLLVLIIGAVLASFAISKGGDEPEKGRPGARVAAQEPEAAWKEGTQVDVEITVLPDDRENLACASKDEVAGRHCVFETTTTPRAGGADDDAHVLKPYASTGRARFLAAGLWSQLGDKLPSKRFSVKCKYSVEGKVRGPGIRWSKSGPWRELKGDWFAGSLTGCSVSGS